MIPRFSSISTNVSSFATSLWTAISPSPYSKQRLKWVWFRTGTWLVARKLELEARSSGVRHATRSFRARSQVWSPPCCVLRFPQAVCKVTRGYSHRHCDPFSLVEALLRELQEWFLTFKTRNCGPLLTNDSMWYQEFQDHVELQGSPS